MFWNNSKNKNKAIELEERIEKLRQEEKRLTEAIAALREEYTTAVTKAVEHFQFALDWNDMKPFSIERMIKDGQPRTIVGYFLTHPNGTKEVKEWILYTSAKEHNRIVAEFEMWKEAKK